MKNRNKEINSKPNCSARINNINSRDRCARGEGCSDYQCTYCIRANKDGRRKSDNKTQRLISQTISANSTKSMPKTHFNRE